jgi:hypothetical protein
MTNRKVLTWLKSWDSVVYPDRAKVNLAPPDMKKQQDPFNLKSKFGQPTLTFE